MQMATRRQDLWYLNEIVDYIFYTISVFNMYNILYKNLSIRNNLYII